jgi:hypothetical protein
MFLVILVRAHTCVINIIFIIMLLGMKGMEEV